LAGSPGESGEAPRGAGGNWHPVVGQARTRFAIRVPGGRLDACFPTVVVASRHVGRKLLEEIACRLNSFGGEHEIALFGYDDPTST